MLIGIAAQAAFRKNRTGVEEYVYQLINHLAMLPESLEHQFFLYVKGGVGLGKWLPRHTRSLPAVRSFSPRQNSSDLAEDQAILPGESSAFAFGEAAPKDGLRSHIPESLEKREGKNFIIKTLYAPIFWTQMGLTPEMFCYKPDVLFIPAHVLPKVHPKNSVVTIHGLEFEYFPEFYPGFHQRYLRWVTKYAAQNAQKIIAVSQNTKDDLVMLYGVNPEKISVIHHGISIHTDLHRCEHRFAQMPYILFLGTKEKKKNTAGLIKAFELLKEKYKIPHKLILAGGKPNRRFYKEEKIDKILKGLKRKNDIVNLDFISEEEKWNLLKNAQVFVYPSFYEGFGMPILEAQAAGTSVITSNVSALPEVAGKGAILVDPKNIEQIAQAIYKIIDDEDLRNGLIREGQENIKRFSWQKCAQQTLDLLLK